MFFLIQLAYPELSVLKSLPFPSPGLAYLGPSAPNPALQEQLRPALRTAGSALATRRRQRAVPLSGGTSRERAAWQDAMDEFKARPFDNITLPCQFSFVDSTDTLSFTWEREDIKEEHEVEDKDFYKFFVGLQDFYQFYPKLIYSYSDNKEQLEERNSLYEGRVWVDEDEIPEGSLALRLEQVQFSDQAIYICKAVNTRGRGQRKMKLIVEDAEEPQVQFSTVNDTLVAKCISAGWYHMPKVTWRNRKEEDLSSYSTTEILEEKQDGSYRVVSILNYPVLLHEIYTCHIEEEDVLNRPVRSIHKVPKRKYHNMYNHY